MIGKLYNFGAFKQLACCWKGIVSTVVMTLSVWLTISFIETPLIRLIVGMLLGIAVYAAMLALLKEEELKTIAGII